MRQNWTLQKLVFRKTIILTGHNVENCRFLCVFNDLAKSKKNNTKPLSVLDKGNMFRVAFIIAKTIKNPKIKKIRALIFLGGWHNFIFKNKVF